MLMQNVSSHPQFLLPSPVPAQPAQTAVVLRTDEVTEEQESGANVTMTTTY